MVFSVVDYTYLFVYLQHIFYFYCILASDYESVDTIYSLSSFMDITDRKYVAKCNSKYFKSTLLTGITHCVKKSD